METRIRQKGGWIGKRNKNKKGQSLVKPQKRRRWMGMNDHGLPSEIASPQQKGTKVAVGGLERRKPSLWDEALFLFGWGGDEGTVGRRGS